MSAVSVREKGCNDPDQPGVEGHLVLQAERPWLFEGASEQLKTIEEALGTLCTRLTPDLLEVFFGNAVGFFTLPGLGRFEVRSGKWGPELRTDACRPDA